MRRRTIDSVINKMPLLEWMDYGDLVAKHGPSAVDDEALKLVHKYQTQTMERAKKLENGNDYVSFWDTEIQELTLLFGMALMELDDSVFLAIAKAIKRYKNPPHGDALRMKIARVSKGQVGPASTFAEWKKRLNYKGDDRTLRRTLKAMKLDIATTKTGRLKGSKNRGK